MTPEQKGREERLPRGGGAGSLLGRDAGNRVRFTALDAVSHHFGNAFLDDIQSPGQVFFTTFHNEAQITTDAHDVLRFQLTQLSQQ